jgi:hypothetical protein
MSHQTSGNPSEPIPGTESPSIEVPAGIERRAFMMRSAVVRSGHRSFRVQP